jgi:FkbM family methyltransferase
VTIAERLSTIREIMNHPVNADRKAGAVADYLRWNIGHRVLASDYILPLANNANIILSSRQNYATLTYTCGLWDFAEMVFLIHLLRPEDTFVDIGANVGGYTILASAVAGARSISFEPVPSTHDELIRNLRLNHIDERVEAHRCGLGEAQATLHMTANRGGLNHIALTGEAKDTVEVPVRRLDDVIETRPCRLMKLDAEGFEMNILRGARLTLANPALSALIVELNGSGLRYGHSDADVHQEIVSYGFQSHTYDPKLRRLTPATSFNSDGLNTLYVRDAPSLAAVLSAASKVSIRGLTF